ncbi:MAG TPA: MmgE/PrpD family protein [Ramlibacter sp.]|uniref:MmgE/PrpD family protein n=1 Tax=Ramlibacter sp. TaxID=1917967 RepID=UPI002C69923D|nr:MmgE/PrpD family protein [Ramlibacter sp.]HVZ45202.1 MmgE/PrpD family protein [Ramlibacter sp.]
MDSTDVTPSLIDALAAFVSRLDARRLPQHVVDAARWRLLDALGSALWGVHRGTAQAMREVIEPNGGAQEATVLGRGLKLPALAATYLNSSASPALLDTCRFSVTHPGIVTVPAALAAAQLAHASGRDLLGGIVAGYEVLTALGRATRPADRGFVPTTVIGPFAAAAAASRILGLDAPRTANALALAATTGGGLLDAYAAIDGGRSQFGRASEGGVLAALLARQGVLGNRRILEGGSLDGTPGFFECFGQPVDGASVAAALGRDWGLPYVAAKIHDGCRYTNAAADATLQLMRDHGLRADDVEAIEVRTFALALKVSVRNPSTVSGALFCIEYVVATALLAGDVFNDKFTLERLNDPRTRQLMSKVSVGLDDALEAAYPQRLGLAMDVLVKDGRRLRSALDFPRGEPENPVTPEDCTARFRRMAEPLIGAARAQRIVDMVRDIEALDDVERLVALCAPADT